MYLHRTLPLFLDFGDIRIVHACWNNNEINFLRKTISNGRIKDDLLLKSVTENSNEFNAFSTLLKGPEIELPDNKTYLDNNGHERQEIRVKWWEIEEKYTYKSLAVNSWDSLPETEPDNKLLNGLEIYKNNEPPVFFGHYWKSGIPEIINKNVCCLDYSVAKGEKLVAYRWDGEKELCNSKFIYVE